MSVSKNGAKEKRKSWPENCCWPEPETEMGFGSCWEAEDAYFMPLDEEAEELIDIKEYMDELVQDGRLNEDYSLNEDYMSKYEGDELEEGDEDADEEWLPEKGTDYWDDGFDIDGWEEDLIAHLNLLKLPLPSPVAEIQQIIGYEFINENLLRQAFTRRAFALEYKTGDSELLEFIGDTVLNTVVTREIGRQLTEVDVISPDKPFASSLNEGDLSRLRAHYVCRDYLAERAAVLGLDQYILYGSGEQASESSREDMMEALIGAVAADSGWNWQELENVVDRLLCIQLSNPRRLLRESFFDTFNAWHQKMFGKMPEYEVYKGRPLNDGSQNCRYDCTLRFSVPENDRDVRTHQRVDVEAETRSRARERAAEFAYRFVVNNGLWMNLGNAGIEPDPDNSINQLQELYQKKYLETAPEYSFKEDTLGWWCDCTADGIDGWGRGASKTKAKKKAAFMVLVRLMKSAGICKEEWDFV